MSIKKFSLPNDPAITAEFAFVQPLSCPPSLNQRASVPSMFFKSQCSSVILSFRLPFVQPASYPYPHHSGHLKSFNKAPSPSSPASRLKVGVLS